MSASTALLAVTGCSTVASGDLHTSGMIAHIVVAATPSGIVVGADLTAGGATSVELRPGDRLVARAGGRQVALREASALGLHTYAGTLPTTAAPGTEVEVDLERAAGGTARSSVRLPGRVGLSAPKDGARVSRGHDLRLRVAPGAGSFRFDWKGSCVGSGEVRFEESEPLVVPAGTLRPPTPTSGAPVTADRCDVTLSVTRVLDGELASSYQRGLIEATRSESILVRSVP